jgi:hypothetical protein
VYHSTLRLFDNTETLFLHLLGNRLHLDSSVLVKKLPTASHRVATALNLVNSGQPSLRTISPFSYDQRHQITANQCEGSIQ